MAEQDLAEEYLKRIGELATEGARAPARPSTLTEDPSADHVHALIAEKRAVEEQLAIATRRLRAAGAPRRTLRVYKRHDAQPLDAILEHARLLEEAGIGCRLEEARDDEYRKIVGLRLTIAEPVIAEVR